MMNWWLLLNICFASTVHLCNFRNLFSFWYMHFLHIIYRSSIRVWVLYVQLCCAHGALMLMIVGDGYSTSCYLGKQWQLPVLTWAGSFKIVHCCQVEYFSIYVWCLNLPKCCGFLKINSKVNQQPDPKISSIWLISLLGWHFHHLSDILGHYHINFLSTLSTILHPFVDWMAVRTIYVHKNNCP